MSIQTTNSKIFGIGLNKTGTTTLGICGEILGYRHKSCDRNLLEDVMIRNDFEQLQKTVRQYEIFEDWPWPLIYKKLDQLFPDSKYILTTRINANVWLNSLKNHSINTHPTKHFRKLAYGYNFPHRHEQEHIKIYESHNEQARIYFRDRENDFLEVCWENGDDWINLCEFLGKNIPNVPFPHANKGSNRKAKNKWWPFINRCLIFIGH